VLPGLVDRRVEASQEVAVAGLPAGIVTFLFTDVEGFDAPLGKSDPDGMRYVLAPPLGLASRRVEDETDDES
jgi:hypothetical protein